MKTAVSSYSFKRMMTQNGETEFTVISKAKEIGFDAIEFVDLQPPEGLTELEYAAQLKAEAERVGIEISCYSIGADVYNGLNGDLEQEIERVKSKVDITAALGAKLMRHDAVFAFPPHPLDFADVLPTLAESCRKITEYAMTMGIRTMVENHGFFCQDSDRVIALVSAVGHPNFGLQVDMGNFLCVDENPVLAVSKCANHAFNVHVKDFIFKSGEEGIPGKGFITTRGGNYIRGTIAGHGIVPIKSCITALKKVGYDGYLTLEFEGLEILPQAIEMGYEKICQLINQ